jgi:hypothetical protein
MWKMNEVEIKFNIKSIYWYVRCFGTERKVKENGGKGKNISAGLKEEKNLAA